MGYFRRKPRRQRACNDEPAALTTSARTFEEWRYLRLLVPAWHWDTGRGQGIFKVAGLVQEKKKLRELDAHRLATALRWFNKRLPRPRRVASTDAVFWFKKGATECTRRVMRLARLLEALGVVVELTETTSPGVIIYEDGFQIAAIPKVTVPSNF